MGVARMAGMVAAGAVALGMAGNVTTQTAKLSPDNPFAHASTLPYQAPPFDKIKDSDYEPALLAGMAEQQEQIDAIANDPGAPTFQNTVVAMEKSGALLHRAQLAFGAVAGANTDPAIQKVEAEMAPKAAAHQDAINLNTKLFARVQTLFDQRDSLKLDPESARLLDFYYKRFVHAGARLNDADKKKLMALNEEGSKLSNAFSQKLLAATKSGGYKTSDSAALAGMSTAQIASAQAAAKTRGDAGYLIPLQNTTQQPVLAQLSNRATRQAIFENSWNRAEKNDANDTRDTIARLAQVRAEKAKLLGYPTFAAWKIEDQMAKTPEAAIHFMDALVPATTARAAGEQKDIQTLIDQQKGEFQVEPWDWEFYSEQVRKAKFDLDETQVRPYFEINKVLEDGVFYAANQLYGITFKERHDLPVYAPDVRVFDVFNADGSHLAVFYCDYWKRDNKQGGAWMSSFVDQSRLLNQSPVVYNVANFTKPAAGEPALITFSDVTTMFHEFGHALHGMFANSEYPSLSGTSVPRDFVEFPSQFNEHWASDPQVFAHYARHYRTVAPMPADLAAKLKKAATFNQGYAFTELLAAAELDMQWHTLPADAPLQNPDEFEKAALQKKGLLIKAVPPRYRSTYFSHIWGSGYAAGYYAYLWSEMLDDAAYQWFVDHGGLTRENGDRFRKMVLSRGNSEDLTTLYDTWLGSEPKIGPMLKQRGLAAAKDTQAKP
jgi:peptidyl-dipeptidase Dcp